MLFSENIFCDVNNLRDHESKWCILWVHWTEYPGLLHVRFSSPNIRQSADLQKDTDTRELKYDHVGESSQSHHTIIIFGIPKWRIDGSATAIEIQGQVPQACPDGALQTLSTWPSEFASHKWTDRFPKKPIGISIFCSFESNYKQYNLLTSKHRRFLRYKTWVRRSWNAQCSWTRTGQRFRTIETVFTVLEISDRNCGDVAIDVELCASSILVLQCFDILSSSVRWIGMTDVSSVMAAFH